MSQPLVKNKKAVEDLSLPVLDFFILAEVSHALSSSFCSESPFNNKQGKRVLRLFADREGYENPLSLYFGNSLNDLL